MQIYETALACLQLLGFSVFCHRLSVVAQNPQETFLNSWRWQQKWLQSSPDVHKLHLAGLPLHGSWQDGFYSGKLGFLKAVAFSIPAVLKLDQKPQNPVLKRNQVIFLLGQWPCTLVSSGWSCSKIRALTFLFPVFCLCVRAVSIHKKMANLWWFVVPGLGIWLILRLEKDLAVWFDFVFGLDPGDLFRPIEIFPSPRTSLAWIVRLK